MAQELARHSKPELTANIYTHLSAKDTVSEVEKSANFPTGKPAQKEVLAEGDFGPPAFGISANLGQPMVVYGNSCLYEKTPANIMFTGVSLSDADGTRTRNHRIDRKVNDPTLTREKPTQNSPVDSWATTGATRKFSLELTEVDRVMSCSIRRLANQNPVEHPRSISADCVDSQLKKTRAKKHPFG